MLRVSAYAKINWCLDVTGIRPDGYHELDMLMQSVSLADRLSFRDAETLSLSADREGIPTDNRNLVIRAASALQHATGCKKGASITLHKEIPSEAGMGGGSSDAAAALRALNMLWELNCSDEELEEIGLSVGADVPFCVRGGLQRVRGIGERLTRLPYNGTMHILAIQPCRGLSTREVFGSFREEDRKSIAMDETERALVAGDCETAGRLMGNALEPAAIRMRPEIRTALEALAGTGACGARMTGSGSVVFGLYRCAGSCRETLESVRKLYPRARALHTLGFGSEIAIVKE